MAKKRTYFPPTTAQQRRLLFETWETTGSVAQACAKAHVCERTFYHWKPRFEAGGYAALETPRSHARKHPPTVGAQIEEKVMAKRRAHPGWGKRRIADELAKANGWKPLVCPNTVRRILQDGGLWSPADPSLKKKVPPGSAHGRKARSDDEY